LSRGFLKPLQDIECEAGASFLMGQFFVDRFAIYASDSKNIDNIKEFIDQF
jgi:hypothetical protein